MLQLYQCEVPIPTIVLQLYWAGISVQLFPSDRVPVPSTKYAQYRVQQVPVQWVPGYRVLGTWYPGYQVQGTRVNKIISVKQHQQKVQLYIYYTLSTWYRIKGTRNLVPGTGTTQVLASGDTFWRTATLGTSPCGTLQKKNLMVHGLTHGT